MGLFSNNRLSRRLLIYVLACSSFIAILTTIGQLYFVFQEDLQMIESNMRYIEKAYIPSVTQTVYSIDDKLLVTLLESILNLQDIKYIEATTYLADRKLTTSRGDPNATRDFKRTFILKMLAPYGKRLNLGTLAVYVSYEGIYERLWNRVITIFMTNAVKTVLSAVSIFFIFQFLLSRHLFYIARSVDQIGFGREPDSPLILDRRPHPDFPDELDQVVDALNDLQLRLTRETDNRETAEKKLKENEKKFRSLFNEAPEVIFIVDSNGVIDDLNVREIQNYGYTREECVGKKILDIIAPQNRASMAVKLDEALHGVQIRLHESVLICKNGAKVHVEMNAEPQFAEGKVTAIRAFVRDISVRKELAGLLVKQNAQFRTIFNSITDAIVFIDIDRRIIMANPGFESIFGYDFNTVVGKTTQFFYEDPTEYYRQEQQRYQKNTHSYLSLYEIKYRRKDGVIFTGETSGIAVKDENNVTIGFLRVVRDITDRINAEAEKKRLEKRLAQAEKMEAIGTLAGGIAHDFNNILSAVLGFTELAKEGCKSGSTVSKDLDEVLDAGIRAKGLVRQILAFSRQDETERMNLQPASIVKETIAMLRPSLPTTIEIKQNIDAVTGLIFVDPTQLNQILMNLCTNAFHAMEKTGGKLDISLKEVTLSSEDLIHEPDVTNGAFIQISICDSGSGIAPTVKDKIFDPYFTTKEAGKGTGMGLSIVYGIVKSYGGFISFHSELGEGTVFHVFLPVVEEEVSPENEINDQIYFGRERILFVDDEEILSRMGKIMLERLGYFVTTKNSSLEALKIFQNQPDQFDLVITDQTMPGMTGSDLSSRMLQIRPDIPIILCTGYSTIISKEKAKSIGIKEFAFKPLTKKDMATLIRKVLDVS